jgi:sec-independent protein translocase protein TatA
MSPLFGFFGLDPIHWVIIGVVGILLFGKRLPEVGRSLGKGIIEFKKGLKGLEDEMDTGSASNAPAQQAPALEPPRPPQRVTATAPKFEDHAGAVTANPPPAANTNVQPPPAV